ncbi:MAG TPA: aminoglycoside phosphotransferase family protein [Jatrophihabitantaceae bacterium]|jgi:aminoglycoside phosphotransferase (APT) family kinase protein
MHHDQLTAAVSTVRRLVDEQFPRWRAYPIREVSTAGTVNAIFRIGEDLAGRFPLRPEEPDRVRDGLQTEAAAMREFADVSTVPAPRPVAIGDPGAGYPLPWSVQTWLRGTDATVENPSASVAFAEDLAALISALRGVDTRGRTFRGTGRGGHLPDHDEWMEECLRQSVGLLDVARLRAMWSELRTLPAVDADVMCHGDLIPPNVLVRDGRLVGVLDTGGFAAADPALDLVSAWHLLDDGPRAVLRDALACSDGQWQRGMAWAFQQAMGLVWYYVRSNPIMSAFGRRTLERLIRAWP